MFALNLEQHFFHFQKQLLNEKTIFPSTFPRQHSFSAFASKKPFRMKIQSTNLIQRNL